MVLLVIWKRFAWIFIGKTDTHPNLSPAFQGKKYMSIAMQNSTESLKNGLTMLKLRKKFSFKLKSIKMLRFYANNPFLSKVK